ncbi:MAG: D-alanyl-D-alanine carboxypeptidase family protein [Chitinophagales bacterium]
MFQRRIFLCCLLLIFSFSNLSSVYAINSNSNSAGTVVYPKTTGKAVILIDASSGRVLFGKNVHERLPQASLTKIMTALLVIENGHLDQNVTISSNSAGTPESSIWLEVGEKLTRKQLLYALMLKSANDAAVALSYSVAGSEEKFIDLMNSRARQLGMKDSHFENPHGLHAKGHYTSAYDLALLTRKTMNSKTFRQVVSTKTYNIPWVGNEYDRLLINHNRLLWKYKYAIGVKTGYTKEAGSCLVGAAQRGSMMLIAVTLNSPATYQDVQQMFDYGFAHYYRKTIKKASQVSIDVPVQNGQLDKVQARPESDLVMTVTDKEKSSLSYKLYPQNQIMAPVKKDQVVGKCEIFIGKHAVNRVNLVACNPVAPKTPFLTRFKIAFIAVIKFILKALLVVVLCIYIIRFINLRRRRKRRTALRRKVK